MHVLYVLAVVWLITQVHVYTLREEPQFVLPHLNGSMTNELKLLFQQLGADAVFSDSPGKVVDFLSGSEIKYDNTAANTNRVCGARKKLPGRRVQLTVAAAATAAAATPAAGTGQPLRRLRRFVPASAVRRSVAQPVAYNTQHVMHAGVNAARR